MAVLVLGQVGLGSRVVQSEIQGDLEWDLGDIQGGFLGGSRMESGGVQDRIRGNPEWTPVEVRVGYGWIQSWIMRDPE
jgi:hypothetical protein